MAFCSKCGKEIGEGLAFCPSCGASLKEEKKATAKKSDIDARTYLMISTFAIGALGLISLLLGSALGVVICAGSCAALYLLGIKKLDEKDTNTAQVTALAVGIVVAAVGLLVLFGGGRGAFLGIMDIAAAIPCFMAWNMLRK